MEKQTQRGDFLDNGRCCFEFYRNCVQNGVLIESHFVSVIKNEGLISNFNSELCACNFSSRQVLIFQCSCVAVFEVM